MTRNNASLWLIGGLDPSGGAGVLLDNRVAQSYQLFSSAIVSCMTLQNHAHCAEIRPLSVEELQSQIELLMADGTPQAIKIGMLPGVEQLKTVARMIRDLDVPKIIDPVMATSSGFQLADESWLAAFRQDLLPQATLITPNLPEAEALVGYPILDEQDLRRAGADLLNSGCQAVLLKGGHKTQDHQDRSDLFLDHSGSWFKLHAPRLPGSIRGTGCFLASAIASGLCQNLELREAIVFGKAKLMQAMEDSWKIGAYTLLNPSKSPHRLPDFEDAGIIPNNWQFPSIREEEIRLYPIVNRAAWLERLLPLGVKTIQLRIKDLSGQELEQEVEKACQLALKYDCRLYINDYWQLAQKYQAYGVHLGQEDLEQAELKSIQQSGLRLGISTHSYEELARALTLKPSYVALGPIFETTCKSMRFGPQGIARIKEWVDLANCPVIAIGGLKPEHAKEVGAQGAAGIALISNITEAADPEGQTESWLTLVDH